MATKYEFYTPAPDGERFIGNNWVGMTFTVGNVGSNVDHIVTIVKIKLYLRAEGETPGTVTVSIRATSGGLPTGNDLASGTTDGDTLTYDSSGEWREIELGVGTALTAATKYAIVVRLAVPSIDQKIAWKRVSQGGGASYTGGNAALSADGDAWSAGNSDHLFEEWGEGSNYPVVYTQAGTGTIAEKSTGWGYINSIGSSAVTQHGHCWDTSINPTTTDSGSGYWGKTSNGAAPNLGQFSSLITLLTPGTLYHVRAYAINSSGTAYGQNVTITAGSTIGRRHIWIEGKDLHYFDEYGTERKIEGLAVATGLPWWYF